MGVILYGVKSESILRPPPRRRRRRHLAPGEDRHSSSHYISVIRDGICINRAAENRNSTASNSQATMYNLKGVWRGGRGAAPHRIIKL